jgi:class 3 adenylate cyclase
MAIIGRPIVMLAAEVAGYSRLIRADEKGTLEQLEAHRDQFVYPKFAEHSGRIARATGDSLLVEFESPTEAVRCAVELQSGMIDRNIRALPDRRITFRVGVSVGRVTGNGNDLITRAVAALPSDTLATLIKPGAEIYGERGNIAMRLAALAEPAGICISDAVQEAIRDQLPYIFEDIGKRNLDICAAPVHCYAMNADPVASSPRLAGKNSQRRPMRLRSAAIAAGVFATVGIWGVALLAWLGTNSPTLIPTPATAGSGVTSLGITADGAALAWSPPQSPLISSATADKDAQAPWASQSSLASNNAAMDNGIQALPSRPALPEIGAVVVRGKQAPSALQATDDNGTAALRNIQAPSVLQTTANSGAAVIRGKEQASALQATPDSGAAIVRGNQEPPPLQIAPDGATDVVRGTRVFSGAAPSSRSAQK